MAQGVAKSGAITTITLTYTAPTVSEGANYASLSYIVTDSMDGTTEISTISIDIAPNHVPVATPILETIVFDEESSSLPFVLTGTDDDVADKDSLVVIITALPEKAVLRAQGDGEHAQVGSEYRMDTEFTLEGKQLSHSEDSFTFVVKDNMDARSEQVTVAVFITHVNHAPVASAETALFAHRGVPLNIVLGGFDADEGDNITFTILSHSLVAGEFVIPGGVIESSPLAFEPLTRDSEGKAAVTITFTSPVDAALPEGEIDYAELTFQVDDSVNSSSIISISINIVPNTAPVATPFPHYALHQETNSSIFELTGTDVDPADNATLRVEIVSAPSRVELKSAVTGEIVKSGDVFSAFSFFLSGPPLIRGEDSISFRVIDLMGATSEISTVEITIIDLNHLPVISTPESLTTIEDTPIAIPGITASDVDRDVVAIVITELPLAGKLAYGNGTTINAAPAFVASPYVLTFIPEKVFFIK